MDFFEKKISNLVENQFPAFYAEEGPVFIEFVKKYYEWMETSNNAIYHSRRLMEYGDVDSTVDDFLLYFKSKYLNSMQFNTATNTRQLIKHSLDLYRSKGSERAIDLFFKVVFGKPASVYFPGDDIFKPSNGEWKIPRYLEVSYLDNLKDFINLQVEGINSGATAFVEKYIRKKIKGRYIEILYISDIRGNFETGEKIRTSTSGIIGPTIVGSISSLNVVSGAFGYSVGDIVNLQSNNGVQAKARVASVANTTGAVSFSLVDGGWGYDTSSQVIISDSVMRLKEVVVGSNNNANLMYNQFETIIQPKANVQFSGISGEALAVGDFIYRYDADTEKVLSEARIMSVSTNSAANTGEAFVSLISGRFNPAFAIEAEDGFELVTENSREIVSEDQSWSATAVYHDEANSDFDFTFNTEANNIVGLEQNYFYKIHKLKSESGEFFVSFEDDSSILNESDVTECTITSFVDSSAIANVMTSSSNNTLFVTNSTIAFTAGELVYQSDGVSETANAIVISVAYAGSNATITVGNTYGTFTFGETILSKNTAASGKIANVSLDVAIFNTDGTFVSTNNNIIFGYSSNTYGVVERVGSGTGASLTISNTFLYEDTGSINTDLITDYASVDLANSDYGFSESTNTDIDSIISDALNYVNITKGTISSIVVSGTGISYDNIPYVLVYDETMYNLNKQDFIINIENTSGIFIAGELVQQGNYNKGIVKEQSNSTVLYLKRVTFDDTFDEGFDVYLEDDGKFLDESSNELMTDHAAVLTGVTSGTTADIVSVIEDASSNISGLNAAIAANVVTANGSVASLDIIDTGFGYYNNEIVTFSSNTNTNSGTVKITLTNQGFSEGYYRKNDSLLSADKYLQDSNYYQEFSYEIRSPVTLDKYSDMLKNILHIAGTKYFSRYSSETVLATDVVSVNTNITVE